MTGPHGRTHDDDPDRGRGGEPARDTTARHANPLLGLPLFNVPHPPVWPDRGRAGTGSAGAGSAGAGSAGAGSAGTGMADLGGVDVDWGLVRTLKQRAVDRIEAQLDQLADRLGRPIGAEDRRQLGRKIIRDVVTAHAAAAATAGDLWPADREDAYAKAVFDSSFGFGRMQPMFELPDAEDVSVVGDEKVMVRYNDGRVEYLPPVADSDAELMDQLRTIATYSVPRRAFDAANLDMTLTIGDRYRMHAVSNENAVHPRVVIRQHLLTQVSLADLAAGGMMPLEVAEFLDAAVLSNRSIVVCGQQGAGKTTLLRALIESIPRTETFATLETDLELYAHLMPGRQHNLTLFSRSGMGERTADGRAGEVGVSEMVPMALRQSLQRLIIGELRGSEASAVFQAMQIGAGMMCTTHSKDARSAATRLASRAAEGKVYSFPEALRQVGMCVDLIVYVDLVDDTWREGGSRRRFISDIIACSPGDDDRPAFSDVYTVDEDGYGRFTPRADLLRLVQRYRRDRPMPRYTDLGDPAAGERGPDGRQPDSRQQGGGSR